MGAGMKAHILSLDIAKVHQITGAEYVLWLIPEDQIIDCPIM